MSINVNIERKEVKQYVIPKYWKEPVATKSELPTLNADIGEARIVLDEVMVYVFDGEEWKPISLGVEEEMYKLKVTADDPSPDYLANKLIASYGLIANIIETPEQAISLSIDDTIVATRDWVDNNFAPIDHNHDDRYYTKEEVDDKLDAQNEFIELKDTPESYLRQANKFVRVRPDESGLYFSDVTWDDIKNKPEQYPPEPHTHTHNDISDWDDAWDEKWFTKKLQDISDVPPYTGNALKVLRVKSDETGVEWVKIDVTDEKVKADARDPTAGYLVDKVDGTTLEVDQRRHKMQIKDGGVTVQKININADLSFNNHRLTNLADPVNEQDAVNKRYVDNNFAPKEHNHDDLYYRKAEVDRKLALQDEFIELWDTPSSYEGAANKYLRVRPDETGIYFSDVEVTWDNVQDKPETYRIKIGDGEQTRVTVDYNQVLHIAAGENVRIDYDDQNNKIVINASGGGGADTYKVKVTALDRQPDYLYNKIAAGTNIQITKESRDGYEIARISTTEDPSFRVLAIYSHASIGTAASPSDFTLHIIGGTVASGNVSIAGNVYISGNLSVAGNKAAVMFAKSKVNVPIKSFAVESPFKSYILLAFQVKLTDKKAEISLPTEFLEAVDENTILAYVSPVDKLAIALARYAHEKNKLVIEASEPATFNVLLIARRHDTEVVEDMLLDIWHTKYYNE